MKNIFLFVSTFLISFASFALEKSILATGTFPPAQFPAKDVAVTGLRLSTGVANHDHIFGLDVGVIGNMVEKSFFGIAASGLFHYTKGKSIALAQLSGLTNINSGEAYITGLQLAGIANIGKNQSTVGLQVGLYNRSRVVYGMQVGLVNVTESLYGFQIGLVNIVRNGAIPFFPLVNIGFK